MILFLFVLYIIIGLIFTIWAYKESYEIIMKSLKQVRKPTIAEKFLLVIIFIMSTLVLILAWPAWLLIPISIEDK